jgi:hypothetical protein
MLKKTITYKDFNDEDISEEHFFHLSKAELVELEMGQDGGYSEQMQRIIDAEDNKSLIAEFKRLILLSYGKKSSDGRKFIKTQELRDDFTSTGAYSALFMELVTNTDAAVKFVTGIIPADMAAEAAEAMRSETPQSKPEDSTEVRIVSKAEAEAMSAEDFIQLRTDLETGKARMGERGEVA